MENLRAEWYTCVYHQSEIFIFLKGVFFYEQFNME